MRFTQVLFAAVLGYGATVLGDRVEETSLAAVSPLVNAASLATDIVSDLKARQLPGPPKGPPPGLPKLPKGPPKGKGVPRKRKGGKGGKGRKRKAKKAKRVVDLLERRSDLEVADEETSVLDTLTAVEDSDEITLEARQLKKKGRKGKGRKRKGGKGRKRKGKKAKRVIDLQKRSDLDTPEDETAVLDTLTAATEESDENTLEARQLKKKGRKGKGRKRKGGKGRKRKGKKAKRVIDIVKRDNKPGNEFKKIEKEIQHLEKEFKVPKKGKGKKQQRKKVKINV